MNDPPREGPPCEDSAESASPRSPRRCWPRQAAAAGRGPVRTPSSHRNPWGPAPTARRAPPAVGRLAPAGAQMAVSYANAELGGVGGHPIQLVTCFIASAEEEGTTC